MCPVTLTPSRGVAPASRHHAPGAAGIVADSVPAQEYEESVNKAKAMLKAFELAEKGL